MEVVLHVIAKSSRARIPTLSKIQR
jgi:hypothetical protein